MCQPMCKEHLGQREWQVPSLRNVKVPDTLTEGELYR